MNKTEVLENDFEHEEEHLTPSLRMHRVLLLRSWLLHFVGSVHSYFMSRVLHTTELELREALRQCSDLDQILWETSIGASFGDAFLAALAIGDATLEDIARWNPITDTVEAKGAPVYERQYRLFRKLYEQTKDIAAKLSRPA